MAYQESIPQAQFDTQLAASIAAALAALPGYNATVAQTLTHTEGTLAWVTGLTDSIVYSEGTGINTVAGVITEEAV